MATERIFDWNPDKETKVSFTAKPGVNENGQMADGTKIDMYGQLDVLAKCISTAMLCDQDIRAMILEAVALYMFYGNDVHAIAEIANAFNGHQLEQISDDDSK